MALDRCYFVPAYLSPFKIGDDVLAPSTDRLAMVSSATQQHEKFHVSDVEVRRGGISYTIDTITHFKQTFPGSTLSLLIGSDQAVEFVRWKDWQSICELAQLCIVRRPFLLTPEMEERISDILTIGPHKPIWIGAPLLEISSTDIRKRVSEGKSINYLTVKSVRDHIAQYGLYKRVSHSEKKL